MLLKADNTERSALALRLRGRSQNHRLLSCQNCSRSDSRSSKTVIGLIYIKGRFVRPADLGADRSESSQAGH